MPVAEGSEMLTLREASERFSIPMTTLRFWLDNRDVTRYKRGDGRVLVEAAEIQRKLDKRNEIRKAE